MYNQWFHFMFGFDLNITFDVCVACVGFGHTYINPLSAVVHSEHEKKFIICRTVLKRVLCIAEISKSLKIL